MSETIYLWLRTVKELISLVGLFLVPYYIYKLLMWLTKSKEKK